MVMRTKLWSLALVVCPLFATAQVTWNVKGALGTSAFIANSGESPQLSYRLGGGMAVPLGRTFYFQPSLYLANKGFNFDGYFGNEQISEARYHVNMHYVELPLNIVAHIHLTDDLYLNLYTGPYIACGLNSKAKVSMANSDYKHTFKENLFEQGSKMLGNSYNEDKKLVELPKFKRMDVGLQSGLELDINRIIIGVETSFGLTQVTNQPIVKEDVVEQVLQALLFGTVTPHHFVFQATVGYRF